MIYLQGAKEKSYSPGGATSTASDCLKSLIYVWPWIFPFLIVCIAVYMQMWVDFFQSSYILALYVRHHIYWSPASSTKLLSTNVWFEYEGWIIIHL
jgi:hypothetical protein